MASPIRVIRSVRHGAIGTELRNRQTRYRGRISQSDEVAKDVRPAPHRVGGDGRQGGTVRPLRFGEAECLVLGAQRPHQITAHVLVQVSGAGEGGFVAADAANRAAIRFLHRNKQSQPAARRDEADAVEQRPRDAVARRVEKDLAGDADDAGVDALRMRQELPAHPRTPAVGRDEDVAFG